jgi:CRP-like cAMP-binding protein
LQIPFPIAVQYRANESASAPPPAAAQLLAAFPRYRLVRESLLEADERRRAAVAVGDRRGVPADDARVLFFAKGEELIAFGSHDHVFAILVDGMARLSARDAAGREVRIAELAPGDFYGEATVAAGGKSELRVVAETDVTVVAFDAGAMADRLQRSSGLAAEVGAAIESRRRAAHALRHHKIAQDATMALGGEATATLERQAEWTAADGPPAGRRVSGGIE